LKGGITKKRRGDGAAVCLNETSKQTSVGERDRKKGNS